MTQIIRVGHFYIVLLGHYHVGATNFKQPLTSFAKLSIFKLVFVL